MKKLEIQNLSASNEFAEMCRENEFNSIEDILESTLAELLNKPQFNYRMLKELLEHLDSNNLESRLKLV